MKRRNDLEQLWMKRFGKSVEIWKENIYDGETIKITNIKIIAPNHKFFICEKFKNDDTEYVSLKVNGKEWIYDRMIDADITISDIIGGLQEA